MLSKSSHREIPMIITGTCPSTTNTFKKDSFILIRHKLLARLHTMTLTSFLPNSSSEIKFYRKIYFINLSFVRSSIIRKLPWRFNIFICVDTLDVSKWNKNTFVLSDIPWEHDNTNPH